MHQQIHVITIKLPKERVAVEFDHTKVVLAIWVVVLCEIVKVLYGDQQLSNCNGVTG